VALRASGGTAGAGTAGIAAELAEEKSRLCCGGTGSENVAPTDFWAPVVYWQLHFHCSIGG
jgi:hypothetical protein